MNEGALYWPQVSKMTQYLRSDKFRSKYNGECASAPFPRSLNCSCGCHRRALKKWSVAARRQCCLRRSEPMDQVAGLRGRAEVPDPYFETAGSTDGFDLVLDLLEDACQCLLQETGVQAV